jgi:hypothetical protein
MTKLLINNRTVELLNPNPDYSSLPSQQADTYRYLLTLEAGDYSDRVLMDQLGLRSPLPFWSRLKHLQERGWLQLQAVAA